jgi:hypothetical protein
MKASHSSADSVCSTSSHPSLGSLGSQNSQSSLASRPRWNQPPIQSIKSEFFTRPYVKLFLQHLSYILTHIKPIDIDKHIQELHDAVEQIGLDLHHHQQSENDEQEKEQVEIHPKKYTAYNYNTYFPSQLKKQFLHADDPQLRQIMQEISIKTSPTPNIILIEQKRDRLIQAYVTAFSKVQRYYFNSHLENPEISDSLKYFDLKGLFEINHFQSATHEDILYPHRKELLAELKTKHRHRMSRSNGIPHKPEKQQQISSSSAATVFNLPGGLTGSHSTVATSVSGVRKSQSSPQLHQNSTPVKNNLEKERMKQRAIERNIALFLPTVGEARGSPSPSKIHWAFHPENRKFK